MSQELLFTGTNCIMDQIFDMYDKNADGTIDASELEAALKMAGISASGRFVQMVKERCDANSDGKLTKDEFVKTLQIFQEIAEFIAFFTSADTDGSKTMSFTEMETKAIAFYMTNEGTRVDRYVFEAGTRNAQQLRCSWNGDPDKEMKLEEFLDIMYADRLLNLETQ
ncbi:PREDICTED: probable calcium-binding protein CML15 isoform X1 [Branchiostoma belcheri]|uniref:Probable calcium-binding protein CML15 isoform X1 n=2 Tax=Branchiostoma belcheri TaxID=7741 RepID=A0A6P4YSI4_BRABE|nr:PREDICTED: probable calcium-binding protein CML15 isoform X1 [Branchiostoma belcheri]